MQTRLDTMRNPGKQMYKKLKWYLSALSTALTSMFVVVLEAEF